MDKQFTPDLKLKAVKYYDKIKNYVKVCEIFECSKRSLKRWIFYIYLIQLKIFFQFVYYNLFLKFVQMNNF